MFEEASTYAPVLTTGSGGLQVVLGADHPGFADPVYRARRNEIAALAVGHRRGDAVPRVDYTEVEHQVWATVCRELGPRLERLAEPEYLAGRAALSLPTDRVPQLDDVSRDLAALTGFRYLPAAGLVPLADFYGSLADSYFHSTQYLRHSSTPLYTPEPDILHEVVGHANALASPRYAALYRSAGHAARACETTAALEVVSRVFWFTLEFGVLGSADDPGALKAYGAGILSSYGEVEEFRSMSIQPLDVRAMAAAHYDITRYQDVLFAAASLTQLEDVVGGWWDEVAAVGDDAALQLAAA